MMADLDTAEESLRKDLKDFEMVLKIKASVAEHREGLALRADCRLAPNCHLAEESNKVVTAA